MYKCNCGKEVTVVWGDLCFDCFNKTSDSDVRDNIQELVNDVVDTTIISPKVGVMTRNDYNNYMDMLKQKIKENVACKLRNL